MCNIHEWHNELADACRFWSKTLAAYMVRARGALRIHVPAPMLRLREIFAAGVCGHDVSSDSGVDVVSEVPCELCDQPRIDERSVRSCL